MFTQYASAIRQAELTQRIGRVTRLSGLLVESEGPDCSVGDICELQSRKGGAAIRAEVVALERGKVLLTPYGDMAGIGLDHEVVLSGEASDIRLGEGLRGRVVDAFGKPVDDRPLPTMTHRRSLRQTPINALERPPIREVLETGVRCIDGLLTLGRGQRVGIFAGSGVGKSTLLGMIARNMHADINVIALIGERGREVLEFIDGSLGEEGLAKSVVVVATADQPAAVRARAAYTATAIAEYFRDTGCDVVLTMDSVTRFAMARREIGLAVGEPATARGYTPSVFSELPRLLERCGTSSMGGSITALYTVLVEGDDLNDPIADALRSMLDGHVVLTRELANHGHYPAIDVLQSVSRLLPQLANAQDLMVIRNAIAALSIYEKSRQMVEIGAYRPGSNVALDDAIRLVPQIHQVCRQSTTESSTRSDALAALKALPGLAKG